MGFNIAKNPKYDGYQRDLPSMVFNIFDKKLSATRANTFAGSNTSGGVVKVKFCQTKY